MAGLILELDAASSNPDGTSPGTALLLTDAANGWTFAPGAGAFDPGTAEPEYQYASSVDTEGSVPVSGKHQNRTVTVTLHVAKSTPALLRTALDTLGQKVGKVFREGGTLKLTLPDATVRIFDLVGGDSGLTYNKRLINLALAEVTLRLPARPYMRGAESDLGDNTETTLPCLVFTEASVPGDVPALGRLVIDNDVAQDQWWVTWGLQSRYYSSAATAALFYEAEGRSALGGSAIAAGSASPSGAGSNVMRNTGVTTSFQAVMSTQATGGGAHLTHVGSFRVYARVYVPTANTGTVSVALEWGVGDYRTPTTNATFNIPLEGSWVLADLGIVTLPPVATGAQRWEGRVLAKSTVLNDDVDVDFLMLVPIDEGSGVASAVSRAFTPTSFSARDEFAQTAGALNAKVLPVGGSWATSGGDADDFQVSGSGSLARSAVGDTTWTNARFALAGAATFTAVQASVSLSVPAGTVSAANESVCGLLLRYVDASNWMIAGRLTGTGLTGDSTAALVLLKMLGGSVAYQFTGGPFVATITPELAVGSTATLGCSISATGQFVVTVNGQVRITGADASLATGATLASGRVGLYDGVEQTTFPARTYDDFWVAVPSADAAIFASQSLEVRHDGVIREDGTGSFWQSPSSYEGDYLRVPPSGAEGRTTRVIVKASRSSAGTGPDSSIDDLSARLFVTPRYLT